MALSSSTAAAPGSRAAYCLQQAQAAKEAGNAALQAGNPRSAAFEYKKVYLCLAELLPADVVQSAAPAAVGGRAGAGVESGGGADSGLVALLQRQRRTPAGEAGPTTAAAATLLYATTLNNLALAHLKLGRYRDGVQCATAVLEHPTLRAALHDAASAQSAASSRLSDTPAGKARLRRASCYAQLSEWAAAEADLECLRTAPGDGGAVDAAVVQLTQAIEQGRRTEAAKEKKMMRRMFSER